MISVDSFEPEERTNTSELSWYIFCSNQGQLKSSV